MPTSVTNVNFFGPDNNYFDTAFFTSFGADIRLDSATSTSIVVHNAVNLTAVTTMTGYGFVPSPSGPPASGTFTGFSFVQGGTTVATITGLSWAAADFGAALNAAGTGDYTGLNALFNAQPADLDASLATVGLVFDSGVATIKVHITGSDFADMIRGGSVRDNINGGLGNDKIAGSSGNDRIHGNQGNDHIRGGAGNDALYGDGGHDKIQGNGGADFISGGGSRDKIAGGGGNDTLVGGGGKDMIVGGSGNDAISGGHGNDNMTGGAGADTFVFFVAGFGNDVITDYVDGVDNFDVSMLGITFADIAVSVSGGDTLITTAAGTIHLQGVAPTAIDATDFLFV